MQQHDLSSGKGRKKSKRVGRGNASGHGTFSGKGCKGQNARSGGGVRPGFEGGQTPLSIRTPKLKGFKNRSKKEYQLVNIEDLQSFKKDEKIDISLLFKEGIVRRKDTPIKLLANGDVKVSLHCVVTKASKSAVQKIEKSGGKVSFE
jgi:large subunit ribosomal protein L15